MKQLTLLLTVVTVGCARPQDRATSDTLPSIDTVKAATAVVAQDTTARQDSTRRAADTNRRTPPATSTVTPPRSTKTGDSIIGRDSAIPFDPKKPRLPVKKPPTT